MPSVKSFPNPVYTSRCLYHFLRNKSSNCTWSMKVNKSIPFDKLIDTLIWRGTDFSAFVSDLNEYNLERGALQSFLVLEPDRLKKGTPEDARWLIDSHVHLFTPRWMGVQKTLEERDRLASINYTESPWIDVRFSNGFPNMNNLVHEELLKKGVVIKDKMMSSTEMSAYKYQIDLGGGGGTSWEGTLTKLLMPGLLFHHETPTKDWFYDLMKPWKHFIPVTWNLTSLRAVYDFAQMHQEQARKIAEEATKLGEYLLSEEYMKKLYQELYVDYLGEVVRAFDTENMSWEDMLELYNTTNVELYETAKCNVTWCSTELGPDEHAVFRVFSM